MAILAFQKPEKVIMMEANDFCAKFEFRPLEPGYGITIGNALRRILLSSLEGYAITSIKIDGVNHEFATIPGVLEDVTNIILNLKKVRFKPKSSESGFETIHYKVANCTEFKAGDINSVLTQYEILNPDLVICNIDKDYSFDITININKGRGYVPAEENREMAEELQCIAIDSIYTPIRNVQYHQENFRVEQKTDFEKLVLTIETDGSIHPQDALKDAARILIEHFALFSDVPIEIELPTVVKDDDMDEELLYTRQLLASDLSDLDLSVRALNCLRAAGVNTLAQLVSCSKDDLLKFRNFGRKSLGELDDLLATLKLSFGMDVSKYKLDKE